MGKRGNGEGSIIYHKTLKRWMGSYTYNGSRKTLYGKTRSEVKDKLNKALVDIKENTYVDKSDLPLGYFIDKYIEDDYKSNIISDAGYIRRVQTYNIVKKLTINNLPIQKITADKITDSLNTLKGYANSSIDKVYDIIKSGFNKAILAGVLNQSPFNIKGLVIKPKSINKDKIVEALTIEEQQLFIQELEKEYDEYNDVFYIALYTGMRIGEILALSPADIDLDNNLIHINKTLTKNKQGKYIIGKTTKTYSGTRDIPITSLIKNILVKLSNCQNELIFNSNSKIIAPPTINTHFKKICKNAHIRETIVEKKKHKEDEKVINLKSSNVNTHMLRHTYATRCIESGMNATVLSKLLGHKDIQVTLNTYTSVFNKFKEDEVQKYIEYMNGLL